MIDWAEVKVKKLYEDSMIPQEGSKWAAGYDLYAYIPEGEVKIPPHTTVKVSTGIAVDIPTNCWGGIFARSGLATKEGMRPANCVGVVDPDYRGPVIVAVHNDSDEMRIVYHNTRIAQLVLIPRIEATFTVVDTLSNTERDAAGFGSTGK